MAESDLLHYYKVLKQFLDISDDSSSRAKSSSSRAQRAREKLLKLSLAQFRELSTDVYDELRRRIDELRSEPDFLLPKLTFHPKRNQARQKLSLLPQLRFKDLVSDISYEIERRNLHLPEMRSTSESVSAAASAPSHAQAPSSAAAAPYPAHPPSRSASGVVPTTTLAEKYQAPAVNGSANAVHGPGPESNTFQPRNLDEKPMDVPNGPFSNLQDELSTPDIQPASQMPQKSIGVQSSAVVPTKANLEWLSDDETDEENLNNENPEDIQPRRLSFGNLGKSMLADRSLQSDGEESVRNASSAEIPSGTGFAAGSRAAAGALVGATGAVLGSRSLDAENSEELNELKAENRKHLEEIEASKAYNSKLEQEVTESKAEIERLNTETESLRTQLDSLEKRNLDLQNDYASLEQTHGAILTERAQMQDKVQQHEKTRESLPDPEIFASIQGELETTKAAAAALRLENQSLKASQKELQRASRDLSSISFHKDAESSPRAVGSSLAGAVKPPRDVNSELKQFYQKLDQLGAPRPISASKEEALRAEIAQWRTRYENVQAGKMADALIGLKNPELQRYVAPNGLVSLKVGVTFFALIDSFLSSINDPVTDNDTLFEKISNIAVLSNKITSVAENSVLSHNDYSEAVLEAVTHALTATRYHATYSLLLPKIVVERAVSQVAFAMCDYLSVSKLYLGSSSDAGRNIPQTSTSSIADEDVHVRPLKISNRQHSTPNHEYLKEDPKKTKSVRAAEDHHGGIEDAGMIAGDFQDALSESLPASSKVREVSGIQPKVGEVDPLTSVQSKKLSLFERILNSQVLGDADEKSPEDKSLDEPLRTERSTDHMKENIAPVYKSPISNSTASLHGASHAVPRSPGSPKKSAILERVKQFESPPSGKSSPKTAMRESPSVSVKSARALFSKDPEAINASPGLRDKEAVSPEASLTKPTEADTSVTPTRTRSLFQSIRERFTHDNSAKTANTSKDGDKTKESTNIKDTMTPKDSQVSKDVLPGNDVDIYKTPVDYNEASRSTEPELSKDVDLKSELESPLRVNKKETVPNVPPMESISNDVAVGSKAVKERQSDTVFKKHDVSQSPSSLKSGVTGVGALAKSPFTSPVLQKTEIKEMARSEYSSKSNEEQTSPLAVTGEPDSPLAGKTEQKVPTQKAVFKKVDPASRNFAAVKSPSFKVKKVNYAEDTKDKSELEEDDNESDEEVREEQEARQRQEYRKSMAAATFNFDLFDIDDPDNTLTQVLLYLEYQTVQVISTIQDLLSAIKKPDATRGELRTKSKAISAVISQMTEATNTSMNQTRNYQLKEHGSWVVKSLEDCNHRMSTLCRPGEKEDLDFADKNFKQRLAGISFDIAKCTKELVKTVEEASLKEDIAQLDARLSHPDDLT